MPKGYSVGRHQAYDLRDAFAAEALAMLADASPLAPDQRARRAVAAASLAKAWDAACDRIRIARGQPLPGSRRPLPTRPARQPSRRSGLAPDQPPSENT